MKAHHWPRLKTGQQKLVKLLGKHASLVSVDPGKSGGAVFWEHGEPIDHVRFNNFQGYGQLRLLTAQYRPSLVLLEEAFAGKSIKSALKLGFWRGFAAASVHQAFTGYQSLLEVSQAAWKTGLPRDGIPEGAPWDSAAQSLACEHLTAAYQLKVEPGDDGVRSALGIGHWWLRKVGQCTIP